jgi:ribosomal protein S18 acetylase RimI-like enzyme
LYATLLPATFQYPENPDWNTQADEKQSLVETAQSLQRLWPLMRLMQRASPSFRDFFLGFVWEEAGQPVALLTYQRRGSTSAWYITNVSVLPEFRRRGIARQLVQACLQEVGRRGRQSVLLDVIAQNYPACALYQKLGFEHYTGSFQLSHPGSGAPPAVALPSGYQLAPLRFADWQVRYDLERRIAPPALQRHERVEPGRFRQPAFMGLFLPLFQRLSGVRADEIVLRQAATGTVVARGRCDWRVRSGGLNRMSARLDEAHAPLAPYVIGRLLSQVLGASPGRRIELDLPLWQPALIEAARLAGFDLRWEFRRLALVTA